MEEIVFVTKVPLWKRQEGSKECKEQEGKCRKAEEFHILLLFCIFCKETCKGECKEKENEKKNVVKNNATNNMLPRRKGF